MSLPTSHKRLTQIFAGMLPVPLSDLHSYLHVCFTFFVLISVYIQHTQYNNKIHAVSRVPGVYVGESRVFVRKLPGWAQKTI